MFLGITLGFRLNLTPRCLPQHVQRGVDKIAHDAFDIAADVANLGELRRLDLDEGRTRELGEPPRDLGLADARWPDHEDVLRQHLLLQIALELLAAPPVAQCDGDGAFGVILAHDVAVELGDDLARGEVGHRLAVLVGGDVLEPDDAGDERDEQQDARRGRILVVEGDAEQCCASGTDPGPHGVGGSERHSLKRAIEEVEAQNADREE
jgi:hypothetical protein